MFKRIAVLCLLSALWPTSGRTSRAASVWDDEGGSLPKTWSHQSNWSPNSEPDSADDVFIGVFQNGSDLFFATNDVTLMDQDFHINALTLGNGADIINSADGGATSFRLLINGHADVGVSGGTSVIKLYDAPAGFFTSSLNADSMTLEDGGQVILDSINAASPELAVLGINNGLLDIQAGGTLSGNGLIRLTDSLLTPFTLMRNNGTITAGDVNVPLFGTPAATKLRISSALSFARFDWDGTAGINTTINVRGNARLDIDVVSSDAYGGTMNLSTNATFDVSHDWLFNGGAINVNTPAFGIITIGQDPNPGPAAHIAGNAWTMLSGTINIDDKWDSLQLDSNFSASGGTIENSGTMVFNAPAAIENTVDFNMNGGGAALVVNAIVSVDTPDFNLDGIGQSGNVTTINTGGKLTLELGAGADENFNHTINLNGGELKVFTTDSDWNLESSGDINAASGAASFIKGDEFNIHGDINVTENSVLHVHAFSQYSATTDVVVEAGSTLDHSAAGYSGGSYTGGGTLRPGVATIFSDTTWNVSTVDIDDGVTSIQDGAALVVNADSLDNSGDGIDGPIIVADKGQLTLNLSDGSDVIFEGDGKLIYHGNQFSDHFLPIPANGSALAFHGTSELNIDGSGGSSARIKLNGGTLNIKDAGEAFRMSAGSQTSGDTNEINGGTINGPGELQIAFNQALRGFGVINAQVDGDGFAQLIATDGLLAVNGGIEDIGTLGTSGAAAILDVTNTWNTNVTEAVVLDGGQIQGAPIANSGTNGIVGHGTVISRIDNNSTIQANGLLVIDNELNDWDGSANTGDLRAINGSLELRDNEFFSFNGFVEANAGEVFANGFELRMGSASNMLLTNGTYKSTHSTIFKGHLASNGNSSLDIDGTATFVSGSTTNVFGTLLLEGTEVEVEAGASLAGVPAGLGMLINGESSTLTLLDGAVLDLIIENDGTLALGNSPGQTTGLDFQQNAPGIWDLEIGGLGLSDFDRMNLTGTALLDGTLDLSLIMGFVPTLGDTFSILSANGGVTGMFTSIMQPGTMPSDLIFDVNYLGTVVQLEVVGAPEYTADYDNDGDVDADDLAQWQGDFGGPGSDADGDGDSDGFDFLAWQQQLGSGVSVLATSTTSVPEPSTLFLTGLATCFGSLLPRYKRTR